MGRPQRSMGHRRGREGTWAHTFHNLEKHSLSHPPRVGSRRRRHPLGALAFKAGPPPTHPLRFPTFSLFKQGLGGGKKSPSCRHASVSFGSPTSESEKISLLFSLPLTLGQNVGNCGVWTGTKGGASKPLCLGAECGNHPLKCFGTFCRNARLENSEPLPESTTFLPSRSAEGPHTAVH